MFITMASIQVLRVMYLFGSMSSFRLSSLKILMSPLSPFSMSMIGMELISDAIFRHAVNTSGLLASDTYPGHFRSCPSSSETRNPIALWLVLVSAGPVLKMSNIPIPYSPIHVFAFCVLSMFSRSCTVAKTEASNRSMRLFGAIFSYWIMSSVFSMAFTFCTQYS